MGLWRLCGYAVPVGVGAFSACGQAMFTDVSTQTGINLVPHAFVGVNDAGPGMERMAPGGVIADLDNDGWLDIVFIGGSAGRDCVLWNKGGLRFDIDEHTGLLAHHRGSGVAAGDIDADGDQDLFIASVGSVTEQGPGGNRLYINNGDRTFTDVTAIVGPADLSTNNPAIGDAYGVAFGDMDRDGDLDLFVSGWMGGNKLYRNDGRLSFTDVTADNIALDLSTTNGFSPRFNDIDLDGDADLLLVADFNTSKLLINTGAGQFVNGTAAWGANRDSNGMGTATGDFNNDGATDWYVTSIGSNDNSRGSGNMLYINNPAVGRFTEVSVAAGVNYGGWGWGASAFDINHDGWLDLVATNGWFSGYYAFDPTFVFVNDGMPNGQLTFTEATAAAGVADTAEGRGLASGDLDNDGDVDFVVFNHGTPAVVYRNNINGTKWARVRLDTTGCGTLPPNGRHTYLVAYAGDLVMSRYVDAGSNFQAQNEPDVHFGLGEAGQIDRLEITWADGSRTVRRNLVAGTVHTITGRACLTGPSIRDALLDIATGSMTPSEVMPYLKP